MGEQLCLGRAGLEQTPSREPVDDSVRFLMPGWRPAPSPWELAAQLDRIEAKLDRLLAEGYVP